MPNAKVHQVGILQPVDFSFCSNIPTTDTADEFIEKIKSAAQKAGITVVKTGWSLRHPFAPDGLTIVLVLAESDMTFHTWPEFKGITASLDICGKKIDRTNLCGLIFSLKEIFMANVVDYGKEIYRQIRL